MWVEQCACQEGIVVQTLGFDPRLYLEKFPLTPRLVTEINHSGIAEILRNNAELFAGIPQVSASVFLCIRDMLCPGRFSTHLAFPASPRRDGRRHHTQSPRGQRRSQGSWRSAVGDIGEPVASCLKSGCYGRSGGHLLLA